MVIEKSVEKYWAYELIDDLQLKVKVTMCILLFDVQPQTCILGTFLRMAA